MWNVVGREGKGGKCCGKGKEVEWGGVGEGRLKGPDGENRENKDTQSERES